MTLVACGKTRIPVLNIHRENLKIKGEANYEDCNWM